MKRYIIAVLISLVLMAAGQAVAMKNQLLASTKICHHDARELLAWLGGAERSQFIDFCFDETIEAARKGGPSGLEPAHLQVMLNAFGIKLQEFARREAALSQTQHSRARHSLAFLLAMEAYQRSVIQSIYELSKKVIQELEGPHQEILDFAHLASVNTAGAMASHSFLHALKSNGYLGTFSSCETQANFSPNPAIERGLMRPAIEKIKAMGITNAQVIATIIVRFSEKIVYLSSLQNFESVLRQIHGTIFEDLSENLFIDYSQTGEQWRLIKTVGGINVRRFSSFPEIWLNLAHWVLAFDALLNYGSMVSPGMDLNGDVEYVICEEVIEEASGVEPDDEEEAPSPKCLICDAADPGVLHCGHHFCKNCLVRMVKLYQSERSLANFRCPHRTHMVDEPFNFADLKWLCSNEPDFLLHISRILDEEWCKRDPEIAPCPTADCKVWFLKTSRRVRRTWACFKCGEECCSSCTIDHSLDLTCLQSDLLRLNRLAEERLTYVWDEMGVRPCPSCRELIQKNGGCLHMTCSQCQHEFCWHCREPYTHAHTNCLTSRTEADATLALRVSEAEQPSVAIREREERERRICAEERALRSLICRSGAWEEYCRVREWKREILEIINTDLDLSSGSEHLIRKFSLQDFVRDLERDIAAKTGKRYCC